METIWASSGLEVIGKLNLACNAPGVWINSFNTEWPGQVIYLNNNEQIFIEPREMWRFGYWEMWRFGI